jgi:hypothetical protein
MLARFSSIAAATCATEFGYHVQGVHVDEHDRQLDCDGFAVRRADSDVEEVPHLEVLATLHRRMSTY